MLGWTAVHCGHHESVGYTAKLSREAAGRAAKALCCRIMENTVKVLHYENTKTRPLGGGVIMGALVYQYLDLHFLVRAPN